MSVKRKLAIITSILALYVTSVDGAIDTATKRASTINVAGKVLPVPDGTIDVGDRGHLLMVYSGLSYAPNPSEGGSGDTSTRMGIRGPRIGL